MDGSTRAQVFTAMSQPKGHDVFAALDGLVAGCHQALLPQQKLDLIRRSPTPDHRDGWRAAYGVLGAIRPFRGSRDTAERDSRALLRTGGSCVRVA